MAKMRLETGKASVRTTKTEERLEADMRTVKRTVKTEEETTAREWTELTCSLIGNPFKAFFDLAASAFGKRTDPTTKGGDDAGNDEEEGR